MYIEGGNTLIDVNLILEKTKVGQDMKVADLGCGATGHFVFPTAAMVGDGGKVFAVDILKTHLETIRRRIKQDNIKNIQTVWSDLEVFNATQIDNGKLDVIFLVNTLYQARERVQVLREAVRMLKKGGSIVVVEWKNISLPFGPSPEDRVKKDAILKGSPKLGLKLEEEFVAGPYHYGLIFTKA